MRSWPKPGIHPRYYFSRYYLVNREQHLASLTKLEKISNLQGGLHVMSIIEYCAKSVV